MPEAELVHDVQGRARIRVRDLKRNQGGISRLAAKLREHPGVGDVEASSTTGSLVIYHQGPMEEILHFARQEGLFVVSPTCPTGLTDVLRGINYRLRQFSGGQADLTSLGVLALLAMAVYQVIQGFYFPPAMTLVRQALELLARITGG